MEEALKDLPNPANDPAMKERISSTIAALLKTDKGKQMAESMIGKLKEIGDRYKELSPEDKEDFLADLKEKFTSRIKDLKNVANELPAEGVPSTSIPIAIPSDTVVKDYVGESFFQSDIFIFIVVSAFLLFG